LTSAVLLYNEYSISCEINVRLLLVNRPGGLITIPASLTVNKFVHRLDDVNLHELRVVIDSGSVERTEVPVAVFNVNVPSRLLSR